MRTYDTDEFTKIISKVLSYQQQRHLLKARKRLQPHHGKPLGPSWFRELKFSNKRVYFICNTQAALFIGVSDKKSQTSVISELRKKMTSFTKALNQVT